LLFLTDMLVLSLIELIITCLKRTLPDIQVFLL